MIMVVHWVVGKKIQKMVFEFGTVSNLHIKDDKHLKKKGLI